MSIHSKGRRDARKKKAKSAARAHPARPMTEHAHLLDGEGRVFGGAALRGEEWVVVLGGKPAAATDSAAMAIALLRHVAALREAAGDAVKLTCSTWLQETATSEARAEGKTLEEYLAMLEAERVERAERDGDDEPAAPQG